MHPSSLEARLGQLPHSEAARTVEHDTARTPEITEALMRRSERFVSDNTELIQGMEQSERQIDAQVTHGREVLSQFRYGSITKEQAAAEVREAVQAISELSAHQTEAIDSHLRSDANAFLAEASDAISDMVRLVQEQEVDEQSRLIVRQTETVAEEVRGAVKLLDFGQDERDQSLRRVLQLVEELERDNWGSEATAAHIGKLLDDIEDAGGYNVRGLGRIESELDTLKRLHDAEY